MEDFYKQIKDNLDHRPQPDFEESAWTAMNQKLDQQPPKKNKGGFWFWPLLLGGGVLALLLGTNAYLFHQIKQLSSTSSSSENTYIQDTIYQTSVIYQTDTIFQTKVIYKQTEVRSANVSTPNKYTYIPSYYSSIFTQTPLSATLLPAATPRSPLPLWQQALGLKALAKVTNSNKLPGLNTTNERQTWALFAPLSHPPIAPLEADFWDLSFPEDIVPMEPYHKKRPGRALAQAMTPRTVHAGLSAGYALAIRPAASSQGSFNFSLEGGLGFSSGLRLLANASFLQQNYKVNEMGDAIRVPEVMPPSDDYSLKYVEISGPALQYFAGLEYLFNRQQKWQPLIGIAYGATSIWDQEWKYEFDDGNGMEYETTQNSAADGSFSDFLLFRTGMAYRLKEKFNLRLQGNYRYPYRKDRTHNFPGFLSIDGGLFYDF